MFYTDNQGPWNGACGLKHLDRRRLRRPPGQASSGTRSRRRSTSAPPPAVPEERQPDHDRGEEDPAAHPAGGHLPLRQDGPVGQRHRLRPVGRQVRAVREAALRRRPDAQHGHARLPGEGRTAATRGRASRSAQGFGSGIVPVRFGQDGSLFVGGTNRGWGSRGTKPFALERARLDRQGPVRDPRDARQARRLRADLHQARRSERRPATPKSYTLKTYTYIYQAAYGSPEVDQTTPTIDQGRGRRGRQERPAVRGAGSKRATSTT